MKPTKRKHLSTDIERNTNKRVMKMIRKDTGKLARGAIKAQGDAQAKTDWQEAE